MQHVWYPTWSERTSHPPQLVHTLWPLSWTFTKGPSQHWVCSQLHFLLAYNQLCTIAVFSAASFSLDSDRAQGNNSLGQCWAKEGGKKMGSGWFGMQTQVNEQARMGTIRKCWGQGPTGDSQKDRAAYYKKIEETLFHSGNHSKEQ